MIRPATQADYPAIGALLLPIVRAGETYALPRDWDEAEIVAYWCAQPHHVFVHEDSGGRINGTFYIKANQVGGGAHIANAGYATHPEAQGQGIARAMCEYSLTAAQELGFKAMQFNLVIATNQRAVKLWQSCGFETLARMPGVFDHPTEGYVDALVMFRTL